VAFDEVDAAQACFGAEPFGLVELGSGHVDASHVSPRPDPQVGDEAVHAGA
jgi:hypothetical protein